MRGRQSTLLIFFGMFGILAGGFQAASAGERLLLPFNCSAEGGNIRLTPAREQSFSIVGARQERVVLACAEGRPVQCRTMIAHNFVVMCGGARVSWMRVAEAIGGRRSSRVWRDGEQLNIALRENASEGAGSTATPCVQPQPTGSDQQEPALDGGARQEQVPQEVCQKRDARDLHFVLPAGFAPISHFGGRILTQAAATAEAVDTEGRASRVNVVAAAARSEAINTDKRQKLLERTILTEPLPDIDATPPQELAGGLTDGAGAGTNENTPAQVPRTADAGIGEARVGSKTETGSLTGRENDGSQRIKSVWSTTVSPAGPTVGSSDAVAAPEPTVTFSTANAETSSTSQRDVMLWLLLTSLFVSAGWMAWTRPERFLVLARRGSSGAFEGLLSKVPLAGAVSEQFRKVSNVIVALKPASNKLERTDVGFPASGLEAAYDGVYAVVSSLSSDLPLRGVLDDELRRVRQRLALAKAVSNDGNIPAAAYRVMMRDMDRIRRIGESARDSVAANGRGTGAGTPGSGYMPRNRAEAFQLLGLNVTVSEATVKKCVDALRMSWHPDLAHDANDLALREERMKQINVAMELISVKPQMT